MKVAVVGGGITGLVAARELNRARHEVVLFEGSERLGGLIETHRVGDALVEGAADWFVTRAPEALDLCAELGLADRLVEPAVSGAAIYAGGALKPMPPGTVRGVPRSPWAAFTSGLVGLGGSLRTAADYVKPGPLRGPDVSIGALLRARLGDAVVERMVDPFLAASRSGNIDEVSLAAGAPELDAMARSSRSIMRAVAKLPAGGSLPFRGLRGGMSTLIDALTSHLGDVDVRLGTSVDACVANDGWEVRFPGGSEAADAVILAVPPHAAGPMLSRSAPRTADLLGQIAFAPAVVAGLVYAAGDVTPPENLSGFLVPASEAAFVTAGAWFSSKWPHARGPAGEHVVRCFVGRTEGDDRTALSDEDLIARVRRDVARIMGTRAEPVAHIVIRRERALPVFRVGHLDLVADIENSLENLPPVALAGAGYRGSGIPDCIKSARAAAAALT